VQELIQEIDNKNFEQIAYNNITATTEIEMSTRVNNVHYVINIIRSI